MRKMSFVFFLTACLFWCNGCRLLESAVSDVGGWDISACVDGFGTCWELFTDNADKFEAGFVDAINTFCIDCEEAQDGD